MSNIAPGLHFLLRENIARIRKSRHPTATLKPGVPAHMIRMQVGAQNKIYVRRTKTMGSQCSKVGRVRFKVPVWSILTRLVVSDTAIDQDCVVGGSNNIALYR